MACNVSLTSCAAMCGATHGCVPDGGEEGERTNKICFDSLYPVQNIDRGYEVAAPTVTSDRTCAVTTLCTPEEVRFRFLMCAGERTLQNQ
jgi:hypothetical protein